MWAQPEIDLPQHVVQQAKDAPFSGVLPARSPASGGNPTGPPGMRGPPNKLARVGGPPLGGGAPGGVEGVPGGGAAGSGVGAGSLQLPGQQQQQQQQMQMQMQGPPQFDGPPGFLFEIESEVRLESMLPVGKRWVGALRIRASS